MKKSVVLLFVACGLSAMADLVPFRTDGKTLMSPDEKTLADVFSKQSNRKVLIRGGGGYLLNVSSLADNSSVDSVEIQNCEVSDLHGLAALKGLNSLILRNVRISGTDVFPAMPMLSVFMVWDSDIQDAAFDWAFLKASNRLRWLTVNNTKTVVPLDLSFVRELSTLSNVALGGMSVTNFTAVTELRCLEDLDIRDVQGVRSLAGLEMCSKMNRMVVTRRAFPREAIDALKESFAKGEGRKSGFGYLIEVPPNGRKADGDKLWEICFDESLGTNRISRLQELLTSGCDPNDPTFSDKLVMVELINGWRKFDETDCSMVELLLKHGADVRKGASLCKLCGQKYDRANGRLKAVELLLDKGLDPNEVDDSGKSVLRIIVDRGGDDAGDAELVDLLLKRGADPKKTAVSLCELCGKFGHERTNRVAIASALLKKGMNVNEVGKRGLSVLGTVIENSTIEKNERLALAKLLLEHGADVNAMIGIGAFRKTILDTVLSDYKSDEALQVLFLSYAGNLKSSQVSLHDLYESGTFNGETGIRKLESLLSKGCDPNERGFGGASLLMAVAEGQRRSDGTNDLTIAKVLLTHGADPNATTTFGETALGNVVKRSAFDGQLPFAQLLLDKGADPNAADHVGNTPLMRILGREFDETKLNLMKLLLERGADVKGGGRHRTLLDQVGNWQVGTQKLEIVRMLVEKGAPVTDGAICSAWRDEPLRRYLLEQSGKTEDDFEVWSSGTSFSVRTKRKNVHRTDLERLHREMDERRIEREERHHQERMSHERQHREVEERISADRRQGEETRAERNLKVCQEYAERRRGELLRGIPAKNRPEFADWLASRRKEESAALESARNRALRREAEMKAHEEKSKLRQAEIDGEMRRHEDEHLRRLRESGAPEQMIQDVEMQNRMREMHQRHRNEIDAVRRPRRFGFDQESALVRELGEYRHWLDGRVREDESRADGMRYGRRTLAEIRPVKDRNIGFGTILLISLAMVVAFAVVLAVVSARRRVRYGSVDYGPCEHRSGVCENYARCFSKYADFAGRADRTEYWSFALTNGLIGVLIGIAGIDWLNIVFSAVMLVPGLAVATRRLHDVGRSGWRLMLVLVPLVVVQAFGDMPMRKVRELGWNEDLFDVMMGLSICMLLVFGIWTLVLLLRKGVEESSCGQGRQTDHVICANDGEPIEMIAVGKDEIDAKENAEEGKEKEESKRSVSTGFVVALVLILAFVVTVGVYFGLSTRELSNVEADQRMYAVIDLKNCTSTGGCQVAYMDAVPVGGWTEEYKTTKLVLRHVKPGSFVMGSPATEPGRETYERQHRVSITKDFYLGVFEVTQRQWELVMGTRPSRQTNELCFATRPVDSVSYDMIRGAVEGSGWPVHAQVDADSFIGKLRTITGQEAMDLPTEAEWEYACRAGTTTAYNNGEELVGGEVSAGLDSVGRYAGNVKRPFDWNGDTSTGTAAVGSYVPNALGIYDMHGNLCEWCLDWYAMSGRSAEETDPVGAKRFDSKVFGVRVLRGGAFSSQAEKCRSAYRDGLHPKFGHDYCGLRVAWRLNSPMYNCASEEDVFPKASVGKARKLMELHDTKAAVKELERFLVGAPDDIEALMLYGICKCRMGDKMTFAKIWGALVPRMKEVTDKRVLQLWRQYGEMFQDVLK